MNKIHIYFFKYEVTIHLSDYQNENIFIVEIDKY